MRKEALAKKSKQYEVSFRVKHKAEPGTQLVVLGSINELDNWKEQGPFSQPLKCSYDGPDQVWESVKPMVTRQYHFYYKYAIVKTDGYKGTHVIAWERGVDRVADLEIMPEKEVVGESYNPTDYFYEMEDDSKQY